MIQKYPCDLEVKIIKITQSEQQKKKNKLKNEFSLNYLWINIMHTNIYIIGI